VDPTELEQWMTHVEQYETNANQGIKNAGASSRQGAGRVVVVAKTQNGLEMKTFLGIFWPIELWNKVHPEDQKTEEECQNIRDLGCGLLLPREKGEPIGTTALYGNKSP